MIIADLDWLSRQGALPDREVCAQIIDFDLTVIVSTFTHCGRQIRIYFARL
jgi:hypothetical protein